MNASVDLLGAFVKLELIVGLSFAALALSGLAGAGTIYATRRMSRVATAGAIAVVAAGCLVGLVGAAAAQSGSGLVWKACPNAPEAQCASLQVPVEWAQPRGPKISLALVRLQATDRQRRIGSVLFNCGGPGCPTAQLLKGLPQVITPKLRSRFDIVGFDPRGTGESAPIACAPSSSAAPPPRVFPASKADYARLVAFNRSLASACLRENGSLLVRVGADQVVQDMEAIRVALRDGKLNWLGLSYGTLLGEKYAARYPERVRTMALDGAIVPNESEQQMLLTEARAAEDGFNRWAAWCQGDPQCPLSGQGPAGVYDRLVAQANASPIPAPDAIDGVTGEDIQNATGEYLLFTDTNPLTDQTWRALGPAIVRAMGGDASTFIVTPTQHAIECADWPSQTTSFDALSAKVARARAVSPHLGGATQTGRMISACIGWPRPRGNPRRPIHVRGAPPILIVNANHDPSTSYAWARKMRAQIEGSMLLTRQGDGHTSYLTSRCAQSAIDMYLITRRLPGKAVCTS